MPAQWLVLNQPIDVQNLLVNFTLLLRPGNPSKNTLFNDRIMTISQSMFTEVVGIVFSTALPIIIMTKVLEIRTRIIMKTIVETPTQILKLAQTTKLHAEKDVLLVKKKDVGLLTIMMLKDTIDKDSTTVKIPDTNTS
ncbi:hypothetical protein Golomagni_03180 [Golovinomyces magnicellulatus]|nr:hypothetical protein Golomagni_03180 [Golovinomyces magnicellulatus]